MEKRLKSWTLGWVEWCACEWVVKTRPHLGTMKSNNNTQPFILYYNLCSHYTGLELIKDTWLESEQ